MPTITRTAAIPRIRVGALALVLLVGAIASVGVAPGAQAANGSLQAQAKALQDQIENSDVQISALAEKLLASEEQRSAADQTVNDAQAQILAAKAEVASILGLFHQNLAALYRRASQGSSSSGIDLGNANDMLTRGRYSDALAARDKELLDRLKAAQSDLDLVRNEAASARDNAATRSAQIGADKLAVETARGAQQALLDKVKGQQAAALAAALAAERARRAEAARARYSAAPVAYPNVGPPNGSAAQAIAFAKGVIGAGYSTNPRMGPTYDCSGLTKSAWAAAGVSIPNVSGSQYAGLPHVPLDAIQPGDLIFYGAGGSSHVALYVGGGQVIDASSGSDAVIQRAIWGNPIGAARVT